MTTNVDMTEEEQKAAAYAVLKASPHYPANALNIYQWGSRVYKTNSPQSDYDLLVIVPVDPAR